MSRPTLGADLTIQAGLAFTDTHAADPGALTIFDALTEGD